MLPISQPLIQRLMNREALMKSIAFSKQSMAEIFGNPCLCLPHQKDLLQKISRARGWNAVMILVGEEPRLILGLLQVTRMCAMPGMPGDTKLLMGGKRGNRFTVVICPTAHILPMAWM